MERVVVRVCMYFYLDGGLGLVWLGLAHLISLGLLGPSEREGDLHLFNPFVHQLKEANTSFLEIYGSGIHHRLA